MSNVKMTREQEYWLPLLLGLIEEYEHDKLNGGDYPLLHVPSVALKKRLPAAPQRVQEAI